MKNPLGVGDKVPNFSLPSYHGEYLNITDFIGKNIVLYFYPKDDTPGCTIEAKDFSCIIDQFEKLNTVVIGISKDGVKSHNKFQAKYDLKHILLSDEEVKVSQIFGCWVEKSMYGKKYMAIARKTFLINKNGIIQKIWPEVKIEGHAEDVLQYIKEVINDS